MHEIRTIYREHILSCRPMKLDDGKFQARVAITSAIGDKTMSQRFLDLETFTLEVDAIERARTAGMDWVDAHIKTRPNRP